MQKSNCEMYTQSNSVINGRGIWHYRIQTTIGQFNVVEYEKPTKELERKIFDKGYENACKYYNKIVKAILEGGK